MATLVIKAWAPVLRQSGSRAISQQRICLRRETQTLHKRRRKPLTMQAPRLVLQAVSWGPELHRMMTNVSLVTNIMGNEQTIAARQVLQGRLAPFMSLQPWTGASQPLRRP